MGTWQEGPALTGVEDTESSTFVQLVWSPDIGTDIGVGNAPHLDCSVAGSPHGLTLPLSDLLTEVFGDSHLLWELNNAFKHVMSNI